VKKISKRLREWVKETHKINRKLRKAGIEPNYNCSLRGGKFTEKRK
jgi:hypothetical protein